MIVVGTQRFAAVAAELIAGIAEAAVSARGAFHVALSGGSTPRHVHGALVELDLDVARWCFYWGDERWVPADHADSNYRMARETLLDRIDVPDGQIHPMPTHLGDPDAAATAYEATLRRELPKGAGLDLVLLGMGTDGHTASLFPGTAALQETERRVVGNRVDALDTHRLTLTYPALASARQVLFLVTGAGKRDVLTAIASGDRSFPAARVTAGDVTWLVDDEAAPAG